MTTPSRADRLPTVLGVLTVTTGLVDAVSVLGLGRVYTANMTGNIVIPRFSMLSCTALLCLRKSDRNGMFSHLSVL